MGHRLHSDGASQPEKPTWNAEEEGTLGAKSHGGGIRFEQDSPEYLTILNWIRGVKE